MNDTTWFWQIVDAQELADVSSDEFVALNELISKAERCESAEQALSSHSLSLSEARAENDRKDLEIERLRADIAVKAKLLTKSAKETRAFWDALIPKGGRCRDCADFDGRCQGDGPPCDPQAHALENLAKLQAASPDLSSLRKGAEVVGWMFVHEDGTRSFVSDPDTKRIWEETMKRELVPVAALVSGSREDGA